MKDPDDLEGGRVANYDIKERLGTGGMAVVYRAIQQPLGREVALKALAPSLKADKAFLQRFELEAKTLARLDHPNILPIYDFVVTPEVIFITMPLIRKGTLRDILNKGTLDGSTAWRYLKEVGQGLQHAHDAGIIHRDLKPNNVLIHNDGRAVLADFGLARSATSDTKLTSAGFALGTPGYMAPEQVLGQDLDHRVDIYAMGVMTFEMMTGTMPFAGANPVEVAIATVNQPVPSAAALKATLPDELDQVLARAMAKDPSQRPTSVRELVAMLGKVPQRRTAVTPVPVKTAAPARPPTPPKPVPVAPAVSDGPAVTTLVQMGLPRLEPKGVAIADWYFDSAMLGAKEAAGPAWPRVQAAAAQDGLNRVAALAATTTAFETVFEGEAPQRLTEWGRRTAEHGLGGRPAAAREQRAIKLLPGRKRLTLLLKGHVESLDAMRGEPAHAWREVDANRCWVVHYQNPFALGRHKKDKACHFWIGSYQSLLRWAGLANDWLVDEVECGTVTGSGDCVFAIRS
ncbi:MAG TPA: serine/threonine-protein kinase, partial [Candidatus Dormibacteraeota bacterium]|nr:serine/threonine-protein kinase [Candidatus Dormibacteraeota bacterium]